VIETTSADLVFPWRAAVQLEKISDDGQGIHVRTRAVAASAICPGCGTASPRVHARYRRRVAELPAGGRRVTIHLQVRRFVCLQAECAQRTFAEQIPGLTARHERKTAALRRQLQTIAVALAGRPGARLAARSAITVSRPTLLRLLRAMPTLEVKAGPRVSGVDDFALRRGHVYANGGGGSWPNDSSRSKQPIIMCSVVGVRFHLLTQGFWPRRARRERPWTG
jgi:transposase